MTVDPTVPVASTVTAPIAPVVSAPPVAPPPAAAPVTVEHISALHRHIDELGSWIKSEFQKVIAFVSNHGPAVEAGVEAVGAAVPALAPAAAAVDKFFKTVGEIVMCIKHSVVGCPTCTAAAKAKP